MSTSLRMLYSALNKKIPPSLSCDWDNDGILCASDLDSPVQKVLCVMDVTDRVIDEAIELGCNCIVSHHPLLMQKLGSIHPDDPCGKKLIRLLQQNIVVFSFHTRLDAVEGGVNDTLCKVLHLTKTGTFGENGETIGRLAQTDADLTFAAFCARVIDTLGCPSLSCVSAKKPVRTVAVLGGAGKHDWQAAYRAGADTYLTGEMSYNAMLDAKAAGLNVVAAGHFHTERPVTETLAQWIKTQFPAIETIVCEVPCEVLTIS